MTSGIDVVELVGEMDVGAAGALGERLSESVEDGRSLVIDFNDCTFVDVQVLRALSDLHDHARGAGSDLVAILPFSATPVVRDVMLRLAGELVRYPVVPDRESAILALVRASRERVERLTRSERLVELRARVWENGRVREELLARRDVLVLEQREALRRQTERPRPA